jgi:hypothetical protein
MKKIQVTTVQKQANVEVIDLNSYFIAKAVKAQLVAHNVIDPMTVTVNQPVIDANGRVKKDEHGDDLFQDITIINRDHFEPTPEQMQAILDGVIPFLDELVKAFEE